MAGYGMKSHLAFNFQDSGVAAQVTSQHYLPFVSETLTRNIEQIVENNMYSRFGSSPSHEGFKTVNGDMVFEANPIVLGHLLKSAVGLTSTTSAAGTQTHVFEPRQSDWDDRFATDLLTIEAFRDVGSAFLFHNLCGNTLSLAIANGELLTATLGVIGGGYAKSAASTPTFPVAKPFKWDQISASYNGTAFKDFQDFTLNYNNNLSNMFTLQSSNAPYKTKRDSQYNIEMTGTFIFQDHVFEEAFENETENALIINFASSQAPNEMKIDIPNFRFTQVTPNAAGPGMIEVPFSAVAKFNVNSNTDMRITLVNTQAYY